MSKIVELYQEVYNQLKDILPIPEGKIDLRFGRSTSYYGKCRKSKSGYIIFLSKNLDSCSDWEIKNVIAHELVHTCDKCMSHKGLFKIYAYKLKYYNYDILDNEIYKGFEVMSNKAYKYTISCIDCGKFSRNYKVKLDITKYKCPKCGGKLKIEELRQLDDNGACIAAS